MSLEPADLIGPPREALFLNPTVTTFAEYEKRSETLVAFPATRTRVDQFFLNLNER
jgi:hypothetical protein